MVISTERISVWYRFWLLLSAVATEMYILTLLFFPATATVVGLTDTDPIQLLYTYFFLFCCTIYIFFLVAAWRGRDRKKLVSFTLYYTLWIIFGMVALLNFQHLYLPDTGTILLLSGAGAAALSTIQFYCKESGFSRLIFLTSLIFQILFASSLFFTFELLAINNFTLLLIVFIVFSLIVHGVAWMVQYQIKNRTLRDGVLLIAEFLLYTMMFHVGISAYLWNNLQG